MCRRPPKREGPQGERLAERNHIFLREEKGEGGISDDMFTRKQKLQKIAMFGFLPFISIVVDNQPCHSSMCPRSLTGIPVSSQISWSPLSWPTWCATAAMKAAMTASSSHPAAAMRCAMLGSPRNGSFV